MAGAFNGSTQFLSNSSPGIVSGGYPLSVGFWFTAASFPFSTMFSYVDTGGTTHRLSVVLDNSGHPGIVGRDSASTTTVTTAAVSTGAWNYCVARFIGSTNRRLSVLFSNGTIEHVQGTVSRVPVGLDQLRIGCAITAGGGVLDPHPGSFAEIWWTDTDIQAGGGQLEDVLLRQLAYGGPYSLPHLDKDIIEYHSLRSTVPGTNSEDWEDYGRSRQTWVNTAGTPLGSHPSLPYWHETPFDRASMVMI